MPFIGTFVPPGDKSISHRLILMSLLAQGQILIKGLSNCQDVQSSLDIYRTLGGVTELEADGLRLRGLGGQWPPGQDLMLQCGNSGTTIRLLMGILAGRPGSYVLDGDEQLRRRPMERVADPLRRMGAEVKTVNGKPPVTIKGGELKSIDYTCVAASAQLKSAVLLATLSAKGPSAVTEPCLTRDHTERLINFWGGSISHSGLKISLSPGILKMTNTFECPGDPSSAAFFLSAAAFNEGSSVTAENILMSQLRTGFLRVLDRMGAKVSLSLSSDTPEPAGGVKIEYDGPLMATEITSEETPSLIDEIPILALAATQAVGRTIFRQVDELRIKETDRLASISSQLTAMGAKIVVEGDDLIVDGPTVLKAPNQLDSSGDHRLAMTLAIALKTAKAETKILGDKSIPISYPEFNSHLAQLWRD